MKFMENLKKKKANNKGFSLVELIIVIAIMAILVGIVGTQVIPYLERSREAKDLQILNSYSTAAVSAYTLNVEKISGTAITTITLDEASDSETEIGKTIVDLVGYNTVAEAVARMASTDGKAIKNIKITINPTAAPDDTDNPKYNAHTITVEALDNSGNVVLEAVTSVI